MDPNRSLFSPGSTTPPSFPPQHRNNAGALNTLDSLFSSIQSTPADLQENRALDSDNATPTASSVLSPPAQAENRLSPPAAGQVAPANTNTERQNALLNMLGASTSQQVSGPSPPVGQSPPIQQQPIAPNQIPTPPGSAPAHRSETGSLRSEQQGKALLDQLMGGGKQTRSSFDNASGGAPSPPYGILTQRDSEYRYSAPELSAEPATHPLPLSPPSQSQPLPLKSMFEFVSPFDALEQSASSGPQQNKKPNPPAQTVQPSTQQLPPSQPPSADESIGSWTAISDPKRQSVDNLLEQMVRGSNYLSGPAPPYDPQELLSPRTAPLVDLPPASQTARAPLPVPPSSQQYIQSKPNRPASPRFSPPRMQPLPRQQQDSPNKQPPPPPQFTNKREKESSPVPRGSFKKAPAPKPKPASPGPQAQNLVFDVSQSQHEIQAQTDFVKSTPIALVKQDTVFLPGTTIGATHWVAYAMTRGRVRVISRSSGDRTLLQLPSTFPLASSVTDMAVHSNRLAGVTSDGGFIVWELPEVVTDDVPGTLILHVPPSPNGDPLHSVKWHPRDPETLAVASDHKVYIIDLSNTQALGGQPIPQSELHHIGQELHISSPLVALDFDVPRYSLATISEDSTLMLWNLEDRIPYSTYKIRGEDVPTSLNFIEGGMVVGRKNGTIYQLVSLSNKNVTSSIKFVNGSGEDPDMFGHINYDSRIQTLWVANSRRSGLIAIRIGYESHGGDEVRGFFEQVVEFSGPKPTIHFVILTGEADPMGDEALAATVAAKEPPGELALVAFSVHSTGVDQVLIRKEWYDHALMTNVSKFPSYLTPGNNNNNHLPPPSQSEPQSKSQPQQRSSLTNTNPLIPAPATSQIQTGPIRPRTPPSDDIAEEPREEVREPKGKGKGKNVNWNKEKERDDKEKAAQVNKGTETVELGQTISKEIRKSEDNLTNRLSRLIAKEMDKQQQRLEEDRVSAQAESIAHQEKILNLISSELTRNTQRVVETAVKAEINRSVLPSLEKITKSEVKAALSEHMGKGLTNYLGQTLPIEIERLFRRPDMSNLLANVFTSTLAPVIESNVKEALTQTVIPVITQQSSSLHSEMLHETRSEIYRVKSDLTNWQSDAFRNQEKMIRNLEHMVQSLSDQVKYLSLNTSVPLPPIQHIQSQQPVHGSPGSSAHMSGGLGQSHLRTQPLPPVNPAALSYSSSNFQSPQQPSNAWYSPSNIAAPKASHPATLPQATLPEKEQTPPIKADQWDDAYLTVLHMEDPNKLRDLLARSNPELIMPLHGPCLVSQAVILTLVHRLSTIVGESSPTDETFKTSLWWLQRSVAVLDPSDKLISDFIPRVIPTIHKSLNATRQRISILPGGALTLDTARTVSDVSETLRRKLQSAS